MGKTIGYHIKIDDQACVVCGLCVEACSPHGVLETSRVLNPAGKPAFVVIDTDYWYRCKSICGERLQTHLCQVVCPANAISMIDVPG